MLGIPWFAHRPGRAKFAAADPEPPTARQLVFMMHKIAIHAILLCDIMFASRLYRVIDTGTVQPLLLGILAATAFGYTALAVFERRYTEVALVLAYIALVTIELATFSSLISTPLNPNAGFQYALLTNFIAFGTFIGEGSAPTSSAISFAIPSPIAFATSASRSYFSSI